MLFDKKSWERFGEGFWIYDGTFGFENGRYGFVMVAKEEEDAEDNDELLSNTRFLFIKEDQPMESRFFRLDCSHFGFTSISAGWPPSESEFIAVDGGSTVLGYKPKVYRDVENSINSTLPGTELRSVITKVVRIENFVYAIGSPFRVHKRIGLNKWEDLSASIPIPSGFKRGSTIGHEFYDMAGFSRSDMYAVGGEGNVWHFNGEIWKQIIFPGEKELNTVVCAQDGNVYITDVACAVWMGRNETWLKISEEKMPLRFFDSAWFADRLWFANDYGMWVLENEKLVPAQEAKNNPMPTHILGLCNRIDISPDRQKMLTCGPDGAAVYDGLNWTVIFDRKQLE